MNDTQHTVSAGRILQVLDGAVTRLAEVERARTEPIAVVGMACRLPGGVTDPESYWQLLREGTDAIGEVPEDHRWNLDAHYDPDPSAQGKIYTREGGFIRGVDQFDPGFFGISPREARSLDPQQRLLLEVVWEAMERACLTRRQLEGSLSGVYIGATTNDYSRLFSKQGDFSGIDCYFGTGNSLNALSGRISYLLGLQGPSMVMDTACSSSLVAVHTACQALRLGECRLAFAGGVNCMLSPEASVALCRANMLAPDGRCKTFDASANGYGRGEGCGIVILKRKCDAEADGDNILGLILGSAVNQDGASSGLTVPNGGAQERLIRQALQRARVAPCAIDYLEAHGTGTSLGDPIEIRAAGRVFGEDRSKDEPLIVGSVKTNIGHLEAAAGIAGLMKVILSLQHGEVPRHLHFKTPNPAIEWDKLAVMVPGETMPWKARGERRLACISSFGASGTNAHMVLASAEAVAACAPADSRASSVLVFSAPSGPALHALADRFKGYIDQNPDKDLCDLCYSANAGRNHFDHRLSVCADSVRQAGDMLAASVRGEAVQGVVRGVRKARGAVRPVFLFTGQGSQYAGMGHALYRGEKRFRAVMDQCHEALRPHLEIPLLDVLYGRDGAKVINQTGYTQPALFALEYALADLWISWGVEPLAVVGHSIGEYAAACIAGVFSLEDGLKLVAARGAMMQALPTGGTMAAVFASESQAAAAIACCGSRVDIAGLNGPALTVLSGKIEDVRAVTEMLEKEGVKSTPLTVSHAFHSKLMDPMLETFAKVAGSVAYAKPRWRLISNVSGAFAGDEVCHADYWVRHIRQAVRFSDGMQVLDEQGAEIYLEIGPRPVLTGMARNCVSARGQEWLASLKPGQSDLKQMDSALGVLYAKGVDPDWAAVYAHRNARKQILPTYPFQRERFWVTGQEHASGVGDWLYETAWPVKMRRGRQTVPRYLPGPADIAQTLAAEVDRLGKDVTVDTYMQAVDRLESLAARYAWKALKALGFAVEAGGTFTTATLAATLAVTARNRNLFGRMLEMLGEEGLFEKHGDIWTVLSDQGLPDPAILAVQMKELAGPVDIELTMLTRCGQHLADVLKGACDPLSLLFPEGDMATAARLYQDAFGAKIMNELAAKAVSAALQKLPEDRLLRILEVGAGTGGTTAYILPLLPADRTAYVFTDVSLAFAHQARVKFAEYPFVTYSALDAEKAPGIQGVEEQSFDLVLATNVLHATKDVQATLANIRQLLQPGGLLVFVEGTAKLRFIDLIFGMTDGWWRFEDTDVRSTHPLLSASVWKDVIGRVGYSSVDALSASGSGLLARQAVIMAQATGDSAAQDAREKWLLLADRSGVAAPLIDRLQAHGVMGRLVYADGQGAVTDSSAISKLMDETEKELGGLDGVVHMWGLDTETAVHLDEAALQEAQALACASVLHVAQALLTRPGGKVPRLLVVTRGAVSAGLQEMVPGVAQSTAWGLGKIIALEHPELACVRLDLDAVSSGSADSLSVLGEMIGPDGEDQVALRCGRRHVARLVRKHEVAQKAAVSFREDGTYLITGGLGGLGLRVADWMVSRGAKHFVLTSRQGLTAAVTPAVELLRRRGACVDAVAVDVCDQPKMIALIAGLSASAFPLCGVIHAVGVLDDGAILQQSWARFERVLDPKVRGAWNLHTLTKQLPLDFFVLFSSATSLFGSSGQSNHAAANAFLDSLAAYRRSQGLPGLSINWGPWSEIGAAAAREIGGRVKEKGIGTIAPADGLDVLEILMGETLLSEKAPVQVGVVPVVWSQFPAKLAAMPFFAGLAQTAERQPAEPEEVNVADRIAQLSRSKQQEWVLDHVRKQAAAVLGIARPESMDSGKGFFEMGMDSLTSVAFRNRLQKSMNCTLPATIAFDRPTLELMVAYLLESVFAVQAVPAPEPVEVVQESGREMEALSEIEIGLLLDAELAAIEQREGKHA